MRESRLKPWIYRKHCQKLDTIILLKLWFALHEKNIRKKNWEMPETLALHVEERRQKSHLHLHCSSHPSWGVGSMHDLPGRNHGNSTTPNLIGRVSACLGTALSLSTAQLRLCWLQRSTKRAGTHSHQHIVPQPSKKFLHSLVLHPPTQMQEFVAWKVEICISTGL